MPDYNKGDFTQQGVAGHVNAILRLNEKRYVGIDLTTNEEAEGCTIAGTVTDLLNDKVYNIGSGASGKITITENGTDIDVARYRLADVNVSGGGGVTTYDYTVSITNTASTDILVSSAGCGIVDIEGTVGSGIVYTNNTTLTNASDPVTIQGSCVAGDITVPVVAFLERTDSHVDNGITVTTSNEVNASCQYSDGMLLVMITGDNASIDISLSIES